MHSNRPVTISKSEIVYLIFQFIISNVSSVSNKSPIRVLILCYLVFTGRFTMRNKLQVVYSKLCAVRVNLWRLLKTRERWEV